MEIKKEDIIDLEEIFLQEQVGKNEEDIDIEDRDTKGEYEDSDVEHDIKMLETLLRRLKRT